MTRKQLQLLKTCRLSQLSSRLTNRHLKTIESLQEILYYHLSGKTMIIINQQPIVIKHLLQKRTKKVKKKIRRLKISSRNKYQKKRNKLMKLSQIGCLSIGSKSYPPRQTQANSDTSQTFSRHPTDTLKYGTF